VASETYLGNPNLKNVGQKIEWTEESLTEYMKCKESPEYFIGNFVKIIHVDRGLVPFDMYDYQKDMIHKFNDNRFVICKMPRQTGKSTTIISFLLWYVLFNESVNVAILANKGMTARELLAVIPLFAKIATLTLSLNRTYQRRKDIIVVDLPVCLGILQITKRLSLNL
jgi:hypothetical protein